MSAATVTDPTPPNDVVAERALLGHVLNLQEIPEAAAALTADDFYNIANAAVWSAAAELSAQGEKCGLSAVHSRLRESERLKGALDATYLASLCEAHPTDPAHDAAEIKKCTQQRRLIDAARRILQRAQESSEPVPDQLQRADDELDKVLSNGQRGRFTFGSFADIAVRSSSFLLPGVLPDEELVVFIGEEGIGKGLFCVNCIARVTRAGHNVLIIATEDDYERVLKPRLDVAGADVSRCYFMAADPNNVQAGQPTFPKDLAEVRRRVRKHNIRLVYIDPWVSSVSGGLKLRDIQDARQAIDPLSSLARSTHCTVLAVAHPNRIEGDLRARVGLTAVLRQAARILLFALEPPEDDTKLIVGIEKANNARRAPATVYRKVPRNHPALPDEPVYAIEEITGEPALTIRHWYDRVRPDRNHRTTDRWPEVQAAADRGLVHRSDIVAIYTNNGSTEAAADKAIGRWTKTGKLRRRQETGVYEVLEDDPYN